MDDALAAYAFGWTDGRGGSRDDSLTDHPDYLVGLADGQLAAFEDALTTAVRDALGQTEAS